MNCGIMGTKIIFCRCSYMKLIQSIPTAVSNILSSNKAIDTITSTTRLQIWFFHMETILKQNYWVLPGMSRSSKQGCGRSHCSSVCWRHSELSPVLRMELDFINHTGWRDGGFNTIIRTQSTFCVTLNLRLRMTSSSLMILSKKGMMYINQ